jgi:hypothetical protein
MFVYLANTVRPSSNILEACPAEMGKTAPTIEFIARARADERMRASAKAPAITIARIFFKKITSS